MLFPKRSKFRKLRKGRCRGIRSKLGMQGSEVYQGSFGIKSLESARVTAKQLEACRLMLRRAMGRGAGKSVRLCVFPDLPITKKPIEVRMGKGKGNLDRWAVKVKAGQVLYELEGISLIEASKAARSAGHKFPMKTRLTTNLFRG